MDLKLPISESECMANYNYRLRNSYYTVQIYLFKG